MLQSRCQSQASKSSPDINPNKRRMKSHGADNGLGMKRSPDVQFWASGCKGWFGSASGLLRGSWAGPGTGVRLGNLAKDRVLRRFPGCTPDSGASAPGLPAREPGSRGTTWIPLLFQRLSRSYPCFGR